MYMIYTEKGSGSGIGVGGKVIVVLAKGVQTRARAGRRAIPYDPDHVMRGNKYDSGSPWRETLYQFDEIKRMLGDEYKRGG